MQRLQVLDLGCDVDELGQILQCKAPAARRGRHGQVDPDQRPARGKAALALSEGIPRVPGEVGQRLGHVRPVLGVGDVEES